MGKKTLQIQQLFITLRSFDRSFYRTVVYCLLIYARLTICAENLLLLHPLTARLSTETAAFVSFGLFVASVFVSGYIQTFISASRCCRFHPSSASPSFIVVSLSIVHCRPSRPFFRSLLLLPPSPCHSVVYFAFLSPLSAS